MTTESVPSLGDGPVVWSDKSEWVLEARQERSRKTMRKILDAALMLFIRKGYEATTVADIAALADIAPGSLYRRFSDKDALLFAITDSYYATRLKEFDDLVAAHFDRAETVAEILVLYNRMIFSAYRKDAGLIRLMERRALVDAAMRRRVLQNTGYVADRVGACLARLRPGTASEIIIERMSTWHGILHNTLAMALLPDDGEPVAPLSLNDPKLEADMLGLLRTWFLL
jgi:AcrR family transcriptional regulator